MRHLHIIVIRVISSKWSQPKSWKAVSVGYTLFRYLQYIKRVSLWLASCMVGQHYKRLQYIYPIFTRFKKIQLGSCILCLKYVGKTGLITSAWRLEPRDTWTNESLGTIWIYMLSGCLIVPSFSDSSN